ncbi:MAG TPA: hypothetical protein VHL50_04870, partial [Pyrinomonadaceae bacterium]|nr:hypothetical protein [Pyrinomonadaceae bacterium]
MGEFRKASPRHVSPATGKGEVSGLKATKYASTGELNNRKLPGREISVIGKREGKIRNGRLAGVRQLLILLAPQLRLELTTLRLTAI